MERTERPSVIAMVRLLLLTGARLGEILRLRWEQIDWEHGMVRLSDSKTGARTLYLPPPAQEVLRQLERIEGNPWCLPGKIHGQPLVNPQKPWRRIRRQAGLDDVRLHDLRYVCLDGGTRRIQSPNDRGTPGTSGRRDDGALCASCG